MKKLRNIITTAILSLSLVTPSFAIGNNEVLYIYGKGLNETEITSVANTLEVNMEEARTDAATGADLEKYLGYSTADVNMISSLSVNFNPEAEGIKVDILTPQNITSVTQADYINASITAGIRKADIKIASPRKVTGESALVGVYKAAEMTGQTIDPKRAQLAQQELKTLNEISEENESNQEFDNTELNQVVIEIKELIINEKEKDGELTKEDIERIVNEILAKYDMNKVLSDNNINILVNYFVNFGNSDAAKDKITKENIESFKKNITDSATEFYNQNKEEIDNIYNEAKESGLLDSLANLFAQIVDFFAGLFGSNEG